MKFVLCAVLAVIVSGLTSVAIAVPITAKFDLEIDDCVVFDTGVPYLMADDCTGTITVNTDTDIMFKTPDAEQTGNMVIRISSPTYGSTSATIFNYLEYYFDNPDGTLTGICISYCFSTDYDGADGLSFGWGAYFGMPYSSGSFSSVTGKFDYDDAFRNPDGTKYGVTVIGSIVPNVPLPSSVLMLLLGGFGLLMIACFGHRTSEIVI